MSAVVSSPAGAPPAARHRLLVEAEPHANMLLRLLEPFVIHDVLPGRIHSAADDDALRVELDFSAAADLAVRLRGRLAVMVGVRDAALAGVMPEAAGAAQSAVEQAA